MIKNLQALTNTLWQKILSSLIYLSNNKNTIEKVDKSKCKRLHENIKLKKVKHVLHRDVACFFEVAVKNDSKLKVPFH